VRFTQFNLNCTHFAS